MRQSLDGSGDPNTADEYKYALAAIYPIAYKLKFASKSIDCDYAVPPLEVLWWADDMTTFTERREKNAWQWTMMLLVPDWLEDGDIERAREVAGAKRSVRRLGDVRFQTLAEGTCLQTLHVGPFDDEGPVLAEIYEHFIPGQGLKMRGHHHEIYLSDIRKVDPARLRTILRQPVSAL